MKKTNDELLKNEIIVKMKFGDLLTLRLSLESIYEFLLTVDTKNDKECDELDKQSTRVSKMLKLFKPENCRRMK